MKYPARYGLSILRKPALDLKYPPRYGLSILRKTALDLCEERMGTDGAPYLWKLREVKNAPVGRPPSWEVLIKEDGKKRGAVAFTISSTFLKRK